MDFVLFSKHTVSPRTISLRVIDGCQLIKIYISARIVHCLIFVYISHIVQYSLVVRFERLCVVYMQYTHLLLPLLLYCVCLYCAHYQNLFCVEIYWTKIERHNSFCCMCVCTPLVQPRARACVIFCLAFAIFQWVSCSFVQWFWFVGYCFYAICGFYIVCSLLCVCVVYAQCRKPFKHIHSLVSWRILFFKKKKRL